MKHVPNSPPWRSLGHPPPDELAATRRVLHEAAQLVAAVGVCLLPPRPDDSHTNMGWFGGQSALAGQPLPTGHRVALRPADLTILVLDTANTVVESLPLAGLTLTQARHRLGESLVDVRGQALPRPLGAMHYTIAEHPINTDGAPFPPPSRSAARELSNWFANAHGLLQTVTAGVPQASPARCWPHHFDLASLIVLEHDAKGEMSRTVSVGLSPGDGSYDEPYWYASPWPRPEHPTTPALAGGGHWHTDGWFGAVLSGTVVAETRQPGIQAGLSEGFIRSALGALNVPEPSRAAR